MCLQADRPLIESGTEGYLGQVSVHKKDVFECFDCNPHPTAKTYAICTIRTNPSAPIHCIVWAKKLFADLFGAQGSDGGVLEVEAEEGQQSEDFAALGRYNRESQGGLWVFHKAFNADIHRLRRVGQALFEKDRLPVPIDIEALPADRSAPAAAAALPDQRVWALAECVDVFLKTYDRLKLRAGQAPLDWDKDDDEALEFVVAAANIRSYIFHIELQSKFQVKEQAGNIVPVVGTTNAIIAGMMVLQAVKAVNESWADCYLTNLFRQPSNKRMALVSKPVKPGHMREPAHPTCYVCSRSVLSLEIDTDATTFGKFINEFLVKHLSMVYPTILNADGDQIYESGDDLEEDEKQFFHAQLPSTLRQKGLAGRIISCSDFHQEFACQIAIQHRQFDPTKDQWFVLQGSVAPAGPAVATAAVEVELPQSTGSAQPGRSPAGPILLDDFEEDLQIVDHAAPAANHNHTAAPATSDKKRGADTSDSAAKRVKLG